MAIIYLENLWYLSHLHMQCENQDICLLFSCDGHGSSHAAQRTVTLSDVRNVAFLLGIGLASASFTFLVEIIVNKTVNKLRGGNMVWPG